MAIRPSSAEMSCSFWTTRDEPLSQNTVSGTHAIRYCVVLCSCLHMIVENMMCTQVYHVDLTQSQDLDEIKYQNVTGESTVWYSVVKLF